MSNNLFDLMIAECVNEWPMAITFILFLIFVFFMFWLMFKQSEK